MYFADIRLEFERIHEEIQVANHAPLSTMESILMPLDIFDQYPFRGWAQEICCDEGARSSSEMFYVKSAGNFNFAHSSLLTNPFRLFNMKRQSEGVVVEFGNYHPPPNRHQLHSLTGSKSHFFPWIHRASRLPHTESCI